MPRLKAIIISLFIAGNCLMMHRAIGQTVSKNERYSETVFATAEIEKNNADVLLNVGVRAFIFSQNSPSLSIEKNLAAISAYLGKHPDAIVSLIIESAIEAREFRNWLSTHQLVRYVYFKRNLKEWPLLSEMIANNRRLVIFTKTPIEQCFLWSDYLKFNTSSDIESNNKIELNSNKKTVFVYRPLAKNVLQLSQQDTTLRFNSLMPWKRRGIIPTFLTTSESLVPQCVATTQHLNSRDKYRAKVYFENKILSEIHWNNDKQTIITDGDVCFPASDDNYDLYTPWKEGYKFYPEVVKFDNSHKYQEFVASKLELSDDLLYYFNFEQGAINSADNKNHKNFVFQTQFVSSFQYGKVAIFQNEAAAIQCEKNTGFDTNKAFTVTVWVKPSMVDKIHTVVSKGQVFSMKIRRGGLSFAGTGFQSKITNKVKIKPDVWQHLSWVCIPNNHVQFYVNGKFIEEMDFGVLQSNDQSVTIGNNFSNEAFKGQMDELRIWNRALSSEEILQVYQLKNTSTVDFLFIGGAITVVLVILLFIVKKRKKSRTSVNKTSNMEAHNSIKNDQPGIYVFGALSIVNSQGEELCTQLSPKVKELFLLLVVHKNGLSISRLNDELWPGIDEEKAKQNRNYRIQQLKKALQSIEGVELEYQSKNWVLTIRNDIYFDLKEHHRLVKLINKATHYDAPLINAYIKIVERGKLLHGIEIEALDQFRADMADQITECILSLSKHADSKTALRLGNALLLHDSLQEDGLRLSLKSLTELGRNGEAHDMYNSFCKKYKNTYNEEFSSPFSSFI